VQTSAGILAEPRPDHAWFARDELIRVALPAPVRKLLDGLFSDDVLSYNARPQATPEAQAH